MLLMIETMEIRYFLSCIIQDLCTKARALKSGPFFRAKYTRIMWTLCESTSTLHLGYNVAQMEVDAMTQSSVVRARIDETTKSEAVAVLAAMGLTLSDAFRLMLKRVAADKALPFEPLVPNAETIEAMKAARRGELVTVGKPSSLLASLNADS